MAEPLLATKLFVPPARPGLVPRGHLIRRLSAGLEGEGSFVRRLSLLSAPPGFGKTTLTADWLKTLPHPHAWLTLDEGDNDPARFFAYFLAALQRVDAEIGQTAKALLQAPKPPPPQALLNSLINEIATTPDLFVMVLDDLHLIHTPAIQRQLAYLTEHQPPQMHLVLATREEPALPLSRLRASGQVLELGQADLRFTVEETAELLQQTLGLELAPAVVAALHRRSEGWIAGLQLAALSLYGIDDVQQFVRSFTGSNRYILDYLMDEVFRRQPEERQAFLLQTSILDSLSAPLCDAVTGRSDSRDMLLCLEQANLFLVPLDDSRQWYRYHRLFADLLQHRLQVEACHEPAELHRRASRWYAENGRIQEAVRHALASSTWDDALSLVVQTADDMMKRGEVVTLLGWFQALPLSILEEDPRACLEFAWAQILTEQIDAAEGYLVRAEQAFRGEERGSALGEIAMARAYIARVRGESGRVIALSEQALSLLPPDDLSSRGIVAVNLGMTRWFRGELASAERALLEARQAAHATGNEYVRWAASAFLNKVEAARGRLRKAAASCRQFVERESRSPLACLAHYDLGRVLYEWNELAAAVAHVEEGIELARRGGSVEFEFGGHSTLAVMKQAQGEPSAAASSLRRADRLSAHPDIPPPTRAANLASQASVALGQGELDTAWRLVERFPASHQAAGSFPDYLLLMLVRARLLLAQGQQQAAEGLVAEVYDRANEAGWQYLAIQARALQAMAAPARDRALALLEEVLRRAGPEGYVRTFLDAGPPMAALLREALARDVAPRAAAGLLAAFEGRPVHRRPEDGKPPAPGPPQPLPPGRETLIEPLTDREIEVLRLLASGLTYREVAQALYLSVNTVKTHVRNIYGKLGVTRRRAATTRARELGLLS